MTLRMALVVVAAVFSTMPLKARCTANCISGVFSRFSKVFSAFPLRSPKGEDEPNPDLRIGGKKRLVRVASVPPSTKTIRSTSAANIRMFSSTVVSACPLSSACVGVGEVRVVRSTARASRQPFAALKAATASGLYMSSFAMVNAFSFCCKGEASRNTLTSTCTVASASPGSATRRSQISVICGKSTVEPGCRADCVNHGAGLLGGGTLSADAAEAKEEVRLRTAAGRACERCRTLIVREGLFRQISAILGASPDTPFTSRIVSPTFAA
mmetsp:Transcript_35588/g.94673  ORF Transcript_35588/g.94673 Transcript_35588/m.94673 type:complete len:269 (+) Transcript_35588:627-1433(+)